MVRKSKLEGYLEILNALASQGALKLTRLAKEIGLKQLVLEKRLLFLIEQNLVQPQYLEDDNEVFYITERGLKVLKILVPLLREASRIQKLRAHALEITSGMRDQ